jgi:hypothetical protein
LIAFLYLSTAILKNCGATAFFFLPKIFKKAKMISDKIITSDRLEILKKLRLSNSLFSNYAFCIKLV